MLSKGASGSDSNSIHCPAVVSMNGFLFLMPLQCRTHETEYPFSVDHAGSRRPGGRGVTPP